MANVYPTDVDRLIPVHHKTDKVPYVSDWKLHLWIIIHSAIPLFLHQLIATATGHNFGHVGAYMFYYFGSRIFVIREMRSLRELGHQYGFLDGDSHERDGVPDVGVNKVLRSGLFAGLGRPLLLICLAYDANTPPAGTNWTWLLVELSLYGIVLDFWFYWYHRVMHEVTALWKYHRTHHLTKHPNPLLTIYADHEQEFFDIVGIPFMAYATMKIMGLPMGFYEWYICNQYLQFSELVGHSGLRLSITPPNPLTWLMRILDMDLVVEDHDLHHRRGWRRSFNYGKQTRIWDRVFGTCADRVETKMENIDYAANVRIPYI